jgi:hypothetical protein
MRDDGHVACIGTDINAYKMLVVKRGEKKGLSKSISGEWVMTKKNTQRMQM